MGYGDQQDVLYAKELGGVGNNRGERRDIIIIEVK